MTNKANIPREEISKVIIFKSPFTLNKAVKNEPISSNNSINMSHESGKGFNTCGIIKPKMIKVINNTNEIILKYLLIVLTSLSNKTAILLKYYLYKYHQTPFKLSLIILQSYLT